MSDGQNRKTLAELQADTLAERAEATGGLACPGCGCRHFSEVYRIEHVGDITRRVRTCRHCGRRFVTVERVAGKPE